MPRITATTPAETVPSWALWQRQLLRAMDDVVEPYLAHFTRENGEFIWDDAWGGGSPDDFFEPFFNWPLVYLMGGGDHLLSLSERQYDAVLGQLMRLGSYHKEYGFREDQMHQSEADVLFYHLCLARPDSEVLQERARRFAGFYLNEDSEAINYDPQHKIVLSGLNGSKGAVVSDGDEPRSYSPVGTTMEIYGLPFFDLPGISSVHDLSDPANAKRMGEAMHARWRAGDAPANLAITSMLTNAFLLTGEEKYRAWVVEYTDAWMERSRAHDGLLPDQIGPSGAVGEYVGGKWYGGRYGWTFPHGFLTLHFATVDAGANAYLLTRDDRYLDLPRRQMDRILELGEQRDPRDEHMSGRANWQQQLEAIPPGEKTFLVPYRYGDAGWFDWMPMGALYPVYLWHLSMRDDDWERVERLRGLEANDWDEVYSFRDKHDAGHEQPWSRFLAGSHPHYPEQIQQASYAQVVRRMAQVHQDGDVGTRHHVHHWQWGNPVTSEALVQLTLGAPQPIYNGGLLHARLRYFDVETRRAGLPPDVAALVEGLKADRTLVRLVNTSATQARTLRIQAGAVGEHRFTEARFQQRTSGWPGGLGGYAGTYSAEPVLREEVVLPLPDNRLEVQLPPGSELCLDLATQRYVNEPSYAQPF
ncbi:MAG: hypothetical protein VX670_02570 [Candidatus Latescibacterota bacterium]|nr:hypothetical protein [Candidatus Latescibacterota bacterium]